MNTEKNIAPHAETLRFWGEKMLDDLHGQGLPREQAHRLRLAVESGKLMDICSWLVARGMRLPEARKKVLSALKEAFEISLEEAGDVKGACAVFSAMYALDYRLDRWMSYNLLSTAFPHVSASLSRWDREALSSALTRVREAASYTPPPRKGPLREVPKEPLASEYMGLCIDLLRQDLFVNCVDVVTFIEEHGINPGKTDDPNAFMIALLSDSIGAYPW